MDFILKSLVKLNSMLHANEIIIIFYILYIILIIFYFLKCKKRTKF